ncbi:acyltransferase family protein [Methylocella sp.]|uniref:acyltransferase family protein n=1 Tax=Methylocella sp. TaxID=1978226 RepID=UPI003783D497
MRLPRLHAASGEMLHLDLMRFVASAGIVLHHSHEFFAPAAERAALGETTGGMALFVDLFFVISGYVIAYVYHDRVGSSGGYGLFLQRRVGRLVPLHWATLLVAIGIWGAFAAAGIAGRHAPSFNPLCIADTAFLLHSFVDCGNGIMFNGVTWSISAEMVMYLAFPAIALLGAQSPRALALAGAASLAAVAAYALVRQGGFDATQWTHVHPLLRAAPSFMIGSALYYGRAVIARLPAPQPILALAAVALVWCMMAGAPELLDLALVYVVAVSAVAADLQGKPSAFVRRTSPLGQLTYSIYMWHGLFILLLMNALGDKFLHAGLYAMLAIALVCYVAIFVASYFSFFYLETPARRWVDGLDFRRPADLVRKVLSFAIGREAASRRPPGVT